jgi:hypothetical protein
MGAVKGKHMLMQLTQSVSCSCEKDYATAYLDGQSAYQDKRLAWVVADRSAAEVFICRQVQVMKSIGVRWMAQPKMREMGG